jgi:hypothetical protein
MEKFYRCNVLPSAMVIANLCSFSLHRKALAKLIDVDECKVKVGTSS